MLKIVRVTETEDQDPENLFSDYLAAKSAFDQAERHLKEVSAKLISEMEEKHQKTASYSKDGIKRSVTYVRSERAVIDEEGLAKALGKRIFNRYTVRKLDRTAMERAMEDGEIDPKTVLPFVSMKPSAAFLKYSESEVENA